MSECIDRIQSNKYRATRKIEIYYFDDCKCGITYIDLVGH